MLVFVFWLVNSHLTPSLLEDQCSNMESGGEFYNTQMIQIIPANQAEKRLKVFNVDLADVHKRNQEEKKN